jgi:hypothetical protein
VTLGQTSRMSSFNTSSVFQTRELDHGVAFPYVPQYRTLNSVRAVDEAPPKPNPRRTFYGGDSLPTESSTRVNDSFVPFPTPTVNVPTIDNLNKPTCSLNLMCYRSGSQGCIRRQIRVASKTRWAASIPDIPKNF